jgi:methylenetetrahydrofolate dehydrogenase (NADP+)/methenyltetrahydrofolate cyclohydrolase/formyltetrahydrofolate synthetase
MAAAKIDGTAIAKSIRQGLKTEIEQIQVTNPRFKPNLVIFQGKHYPSWDNEFRRTAN